VEIRVPGTDPPDSMFPHEDSGVRIVKQIACQVRKLRDDLPGDLAVTLCRDEDAESGRREQRRDEVPRCGALHGRRMTRGCVVTSRNSYQTPHVVYQASGRCR